MVELSINNLTKWLLNVIMKKERANIVETEAADNVDKSKPVSSVPESIHRRNAASAIWQFLGDRL